jgi:hypothetical protein
VGTAIRRGHDPFQRLRTRLPTVVDARVIVDQSSTLEIDTTKRKREEKMILARKIEVTPASTVNCQFVICSEYVLTFQVEPSMMLGW